MKKFGLVVIGAHFGVWLKDDITQFSNNEILLVEPVPYNYNKLRTNFKDNSNIHICTNAIFSEHKKSKFYYVNENSISKLGKHWASGIGSFNKNHILDHRTKRFKIEEKDIVEIDIEFITFDNDAKKELIALGRSLDPGDFQQTLEKLSLYKFKDDTVIPSTDIQSCAPVTIDAALDEAINIIADARSDEVGPILNRLFGQGTNPTTLCIAATRHFRNLHLAASHPSGPDVALSRARPPVFGHRKDRMVRQARGWGGIKLEKALGVLINTDLSLRSSSKAPAQAILERAFIRISMMRPK